MIYAISHRITHSPKPPEICNEQALLNVRMLLSPNRIIRNGHWLYIHTHTSSVWRNKCVTNTPSCLETMSVHNNEYHVVGYYPAVDMSQITCQRDLGSFTGINAIWSSTSSLFTWTKQLQLIEHPGSINRLVLVCVVYYSFIFPSRAYKDRKGINFL